MKQYTQEMRIRNDPCPYCGFWHSSLSHPPQFSGYVLEIISLEKELQEYKDLYDETARLLNDANYKIQQINAVINK